MSDGRVKLLLVHGLWRTPLSLYPLVRRLRRWGYHTEQFGYAAVAQAYDGIIARLVKRLELLAAAGPYVVIGHSLGSILLRSALARIDGPAPLHLVMLGPPNQPARLAHMLGHRWLYRRLMGECGLNLANPAFYARLPVPQVPYTIVAGTSGPQGRWSPFAGEPNDMIVTVSETRIVDDDPVVALPVSHTFMMKNAAVHDVIRQVLAGADRDQ